MHELILICTWIKLTPIVDVGLKAILMFIISPFDIPPCSPKEDNIKTDFQPGISYRSTKIRKKEDHESSKHLYSTRTIGSCSDSSMFVCVELIIMFTPSQESACNGFHY